MKKVLVIEDQKQIRDFIFDALHRGGYAGVDQYFPDVQAIVLDSGLKEQDSFKLCQSLRQDHPQLPILLLTPRNQNLDMVTGLMTGADDYLVKPFSAGGLIAHLEALFSRTRDPMVPTREPLSSGPFLLDLDRHTLDKLNQRIRLTRQEFETLRLLMEGINREVSGEEIRNAVWGSEGSLRQVDMTVRALRAKLEDDPTQPVYLKILRGHSYMWCG